MYVHFTSPKIFVCSFKENSFQKKKKSLYDPSVVFFHESKSLGKETHIALFTEFSFKLIREDARLA